MVTQNGKDTFVNSVFGMGFLVWGFAFAVCLGLSIFEMVSIYHGFDSKAHRKL